MLLKNLSITPELRQYHMSFFFLARFFGGLAGTLPIAAVFSFTGIATASPIPGARIASCVLLDASATLAGGMSNSDEANENNEVNDDEEHSDDDDDDDPGVRGFLAADHQTCVSIGGSVTNNLQVNHQSVKSVGSTAQNGPFSSQASMGLTLMTSRMTDYGALITTFDASFDTSGQYIINSATIGLNAISVGYDSSLFNYWTGDSFAGSSIQAMPSSFQIARKFKIWDNYTLTFSLESAITQTIGPSLQQQSTSPPGYSMSASANDIDKAPPSAAVFALERDGVETNWKVALYGRSPWTDGAGIQRPAALAINSGLEWNANEIMPDLTITAQAIFAQNAPELIGTRFDRATIRNLNLQAFQTLGMSGLVSAEISITDQWSLNAYTSFFKFSLPSQPIISGRVSSLRTAANIAWSPTDDLNIIFEVNMSRLLLGLSGYARGVTSSGTTITNTLSISRTF